MNKDLFTGLCRIDSGKISKFLANASPNKVFHENNKAGPLPLGDLEKSDGILLGECLRQLILTQVPGWAVTKVKLQYKQPGDKIEDKGLLPLLSKYGCLPGVVENVRDIIAHLQQGIFAFHGPEHSTVISSTVFSSIPVSSHYKELLLGEFFEDEDVAVKNPELTILTFQDKGFHIELELMIELGKGYRRAQDTKRDDEGKSKGASALNLYLDATFNPVKKVGYSIDQENLFLHIETNGAITSEDAYKISFEAFIRMLN